MWKILMISLLISTSAYAKQFRVAVIDTGMAITSKLPYCSADHADFSGTGLYDKHGHGTNIAALIAREAKGVDFCIVSVKYYSSAGNNLKSMTEAIEYASNQNVDIINISGGGQEYSRTEALVIQKVLNKGIKIIAAAGNEGMDFSQKCEYYPACYDDRIMAVGCMNPDYTPCTSSNFGGKIKTVALGRNQRGSEGVAMTGTSQATAIATGTYLKVLDLISKKK
jgi:subtilisin family serine protease